jgi:2-oxoacid:acceptor oxidoreductase delta subunit (pyruvate/2-ketoisovalerate family)
VNFKTKYYKLWGAVANKWVEPKTGSWRVMRPEINHEKCCRCGWCYLYCTTGCVEEKENSFEPNYDYCKGCGVCAKECPIGAIEMVYEGDRKKK